MASKQPSPVRIEVTCAANARMDGGTRDPARLLYARDSCMFELGARDSCMFELGACDSCMFMLGACDSCMFSLDEDPVERALLDRVHNELDPGVATALCLEAVDVTVRLVRSGCADRIFLTSRRVVHELVVFVLEEALWVRVEPRA